MCMLLIGPHPTELSLWHRPTYLLATLATLDATLADPFPPRRVDAVATRMLAAP